MYSKILDLIISNDRKYGEIDEWESNSYKKIEEAEKQLQLLLNKEGQELLNRYRLGIVNAMEELSYHKQSKVLNTGIKIGMELQRAFDSDIE